MKNKKGKNKIAIVSSSFRDDVSSELEKRCVATLLRRGIKKGNIEKYRVPGALEIPLVVGKLATSRRYGAIIAFGAIIKGDTYHFEQVADECVRGCMDASWRYGVPVIYEVLAVYRLKDALDRATRKTENKGVEAAETALEMMDLLQRL